MTKNTNSSLIATPSRNPFKATLGVSKAQAFRGILFLTQFFSAISINSQQKSLPNNFTATRRVASVNSFGIRREAKTLDAVSNQEKLPRQKITHKKTTEEVDKIVEELLKSDPERIKREFREERISKELSQRRQNLPAVNQTEIKEFIEEQKASNPNQPVDLRSQKYSGRN